MSVYIYQRTFKSLAGELILMLQREKDSSSRTIGKRNDETQFLLDGATWLHETLVVNTARKLLERQRFEMSTTTDKVYPYYGGSSVRSVLRLELGNRSRRPTVIVQYQYKFGCRLKHTHLEWPLNGNQWWQHISIPTWKRTK
jgi:hypothetical protein